MNDEQESIDSMENEVETMSILAKGYKKIYPLIEFLESYLIHEYTDEDEGFNGIPMKIDHNSDSEDMDQNNDNSSSNTKNEKFRSPSTSKPLSKKDKIHKMIQKQQKKFIKTQLKEAVKEEGVNAENLLGFINQK